MLIANSKSVPFLFAESIKTNHSTFVSTEPSNEPSTNSVTLNDKMTYSDGDFNWTLIVIAVVVSMVIIVVLVFVVVFLFKRRKKKKYECCS